MRALSNEVRWSTDGLLTKEQYVIVVPPEGSIVEGFTLAAGFNSSVRVVARGAMTARAIGQRRAGRVELAEFDAYLPEDKRPIVNPLVADLSAWLRTVFAGIIGVDPDFAFRGSATTRLGLQDVFDSWCIATRLRAVHPGRRFVITRNWIGGDVLKALGCDVEMPARDRKNSVSTEWAPAAAIALRNWELFRENSTRRAVESASSNRKPRVWLGVVAGWPFASRHVLSCLEVAKQLKRPFGFLCQSTLRPGSLEGSRVEEQRTEGIAIANLARKLDVELSQGVSYNGLRDFLFHAPDTLTSIKRATTAARQTRLVLGGLEVPVVARELALLTSLDVLRAREAEVAAHRFVDRNFVPGMRVALSHGSLVTDSVLDLVLQQRGVETLDIVHGALAEPMDMLGTAFTASSRKLLWTRSEIDMVRGISPSALEGGVVPRSWTQHPAKGVRGRNLLVLSNYGTRAGRGFRAELPRLSYQEHLLTAVDEARRKHDLTVRWRPHPGDDEECVGTALRSKPWIQRSSGTLDDDFEWSDVVVTSLSSTIVEAMAWRRPVFVHDVPIHESAVLMSVFDPCRRFSTGAELGLKLGSALEGGDDEPERALLVRFFGESQVPRIAGDVVFE